MQLVQRKIKDKDLWLLRRRAIYKQNEFEEIAYKLYLTFGLETSRELINQKYGPINYEQLHYLMKNIELSKDSSKVEIINNYLFGNKKDTNIPIRNMLEGKFIELFLNFEYFHNNLDYFTNKEKCNEIIEKYVEMNIAHPFREGNGRSTARTSGMFVTGARNLSCGTNRKVRCKSPFSKAM